MGRSKNYGKEGKKMKSRFTWAKALTGNYPLRSKNYGKGGEVKLGDSIELFEILKWGKIFSIRLSKPFYELWYVGEDKKKGIQINQVVSFNYVKTEYTNGIQLLIWGLNIIFAWGSRRKDENRI